MMLDRSETYRSGSGIAARQLQPARRCRAEGERNVGVRPLTNYDNRHKIPNPSAGDATIRPLDRVPPAGLEGPAMQSGPAPSAELGFHRLDDLDQPLYRVDRLVEHRLLGLVERDL